MNREQLKEHIYSDLLVSSGYDVDFAVGTTYSLDPKALLVVPLALGMFTELNEQTRKSKICILESIRRTADKFVLFCNRGGIHVKSEEKSFMPLLENCIHEVQQKKSLSNFHPKVWVIREVNRENPEDRQIKVVVMSRNLTLDNNLDMVVSLTGKIDTQNSKNSKKHEPLHEWLEKLSKYSNQPGQRKKIRALADDLYCIKRFELDTDIFEENGYEFIPIFFGENLNRKIDIIGNAMAGDRMLIISPFIDFDATTLSALNSNVKSESMLVTTSSYISKGVYEEMNKEGRSIWIMKDEVTHNDVMPTDLHAKTYFVSSKSGRKGTEFGDFLYIGSANCTQSAFHANSEFLLRLQYKIGKHYSFEKFRDEFMGMEYKNGSNIPESLLFEQITTEPESEEKHESSAVETALRQYISSEFKATCVAKGSVYDILLSVISPKDEVRMMIAPLQNPGRQTEINESRVVISDMELQDLSEFYIITAYTEDECLSKVIKIPTTGLPQNERDIAIFKNEVKTKEMFLNYISLMLSDDPDEYLFDLEQAHILAHDSDKHDPASQIPQHVYEQMLKIAYSNPKRISEMKKVIDLVDNKDFTCEFEELLKTFNKALRQ